MKTARGLTVILLVDYCNPRPIQERHEILECPIQMILGRIEIDAELFEGWLEVDPGLEMRDVQSLAYALYVRPQKRIRRTEYSLHRPR